MRPAHDVVLRAFTAADTDPLRAGFADPELARWNPGPVDGDVVGWWTWRNDRTDPTHASWAIAERGGTLLGSVSVFKIDPVQLDAEVGYFVLPFARRRGVARRAVTAAAAYAFAELGVHRIQLFHAVENVASCHVAEAAGFGKEGQLRASYRYADGCRHDEHLHARLATD